MRKTLQRSLRSVYSTCIRVYNTSCSMVNFICRKKGDMPAFPASLQMDWKTWRIVPARFCARHGHEHEYEHVYANVHLNAHVHRHLLYIQIDMNMNMDTVTDTGTDTDTAYSIHRAWTSTSTLTLDVDVDSDCLMINEAKKHMYKICITIPTTNTTAY
jgi:hypothetical protein